MQYPERSGSLAPSAVLGTSCAHAVQFYEGDEFLARAVGDFLAEGFLSGQPMIAIATPDHRSAIEARLRDRESSVGAAMLSGRLVLLDAQATLDCFMVDGTPDGDLFRKTLGPVIESARGEQPGVVVRAFGEMVDLLWKQGNAAGALTLERLWNELATAYDFALLCGYSMHNFSDAAHAEQFSELCGTHNHVLPAESYTLASEPDRLVAASRLQQRAEALETEIRRRGHLEQQLRESLFERDQLLAQERQARRDAEAAQEAAQQANRAKTAFLAVMSHELRTPLNAIAGYVDLLELGVYGSVVPAQQEALSRVRTSGSHLLGLIDQVLHYAHLESGRVRYELTPLPLRELIGETSAIIEPLMMSAGIVYTHEVTGTGVAIGDRNHVRQILLNLLTNATKFTPAGGRIHLGCASTASAVALRVTDTGVGIAADKLEAVFQPFVQADPALTRMKGGVGLGLSISRELARGMEGDLTAESIVGAGSAFTLTLPIARSTS